MSDHATRSDISLIALAAGALRARRTVLGIMLAGAAVALALAFLTPRTFTSSAAFVPQARRQPTNNALAGLAAQAGLSLPGTDGSQSPAFYVAMLKSHALRRDLVRAAYVNERGAPVMLADLLRVRSGEPALREEDAIIRLGSQMAAEPDPKTTIVRVSARMPDPAVAEQVVRRCLELLDRYNQVQRQSAAGAERRFSERRLAEAGRELREAEERSQAFLARNRDYTNSADLRFAYGRLEQEVSVRRQVYLSLAQSLEQARIDEVRDTPVISIVEAAERAVRRDPRHTKQRLITGLFIGLVAGIAVAGFMTALGEPAGDDRAALRAEWAATRAELLRPWRLLRPARRTAAEGG